VNFAAIVSLSRPGRIFSNATFRDFNFCGRTIVLRRSFFVHGTTASISVVLERHSPM